MKSILFSLILILGPLLQAAPAKLILEQNLELGSDSQGDNYEFSASSQFAISPKAIYVLDGQNARVLAFDMQGRYLRTFGHRGEGPGEFVSPGAILVTPKGEVVVFDVQRRLASFFSQEGSFLRDLRLPDGTVAVIEPSINQSGHFVCANIRLDDMFQQLLFITVFDTELKVIKDLSFHKQPSLDWSKSKESGFWVDFLAAQFDTAMNFTYSAATPKGYVLAHPQKYDLELFNLEGAESGKLSFPFKPKVMNEDSRRRVCEQVYESIRSAPFIGPNLNNRIFEDALKKCKTPPIQSPIRWLFGTDKGFGTLVDYSEERQTGRIELFDAKGKLIGQGEYRGEPGVLSYANGQLYNIHRDDDDVVRLRRYAIKGL